MIPLHTAVLRLKDSSSLYVSAYVNFTPNQFKLFLFFQAWHNEYTIEYKCHVSNFTCNIYVNFGGLVLFVVFSRCLNEDSLKYYTNQRSVTFELFMYISLSNFRWQFKQMRMYIYQDEFYIIVILQIKDLYCFIRFSAIHV